jgi:hypothetical protein
MFKEAVQQMVQEGMRSVTHPVQGYIPEGGVDEANNICSVRIPNPHGGIHPGEDGGGNYIELRAVPLPFYFKGIIGGILDLFQGGAGSEGRGVMVGFRGGNMAHPFIMHPVSMVHAAVDAPAKSVDARVPQTINRLKNPAGTHKLVPPRTSTPVSTSLTFQSIGTAKSLQKPLTIEGPALTQLTDLKTRISQQTDSILGRTPGIRVGAKR